MMFLVLLGVALAVPAEAPAPDPLLAWMNGIAQQHLDRRDKAIAQIRTKAQAEERKKVVKAKIMDLIGGLPSYAGPLNARITAIKTNASYTMEKVIYESLPGFYVTADLYRPNQPGRYPAVLMSAGHNTYGKLENHQMAANLAAKGFIALAPDPLGLGERVQALDPRTRKHAGGCCANEHLQFGAQSMLIGQSAARYFIWDARRSLDYLVSRPDVDAERIGAGGCSGGGNITTYIAALDPRVKVAAPACYLNSYRQLFTGSFPDTEMNIPGFLAAGLDHADYVELVAPKPWLILATEGDFFTPAGVRPVYEEARRWYALYGAEENVKYFVGPGPHGTPIQTREQLYGWMIRWLKDGKGDPRELDIPLYPDAELVVTATGQVDDEKNSLKVYDLVRAELRAHRDPKPLAALAAELLRLGIPTGRRAPQATQVAGKTEAGLRQMRLRFATEPGVEIEATLYAPQSPGRKPALLLVHDPSTSALARQVAASGTVVLDLEPRDSPATNDKRPYLGNWLVNLRADSIGRALPALRAHDILRGIDLLAARDDVDPAAIRAAARDVKGVWLLLAAAADPRIAGISLDRTPFSYEAAMDRALNTNLFDGLVRGFLLHWDLSDLVRLMGKRPVAWWDPSDWMGVRVYAGTGYRYRSVTDSESAWIESSTANTY